MNRILILVLYGILSITVYAQNATGVIQGKVLNATTLQPVPFANVLIPGTNTGAATDENGEFRIDNIKAGIYQLKASAVGYRSTVKTNITVTNNKPATVEFELIEVSVELESVTVTSDYFYRTPTDVNSIRTFGYEEIRRSPGGFEDVVRALSILPGVAQVSAGRNDLLVRGGSPSENLYLLDGIEIPNINHFGTQGVTGGTNSYINLDFVKETSFSTGAFPVMYGDKLSSVLRINLRKGREDRFGGKATISATQFGLNIESPVTDNSSFFLSARRSYLDFIFKAADFGFVPEYYDLLSKYSIDIDKKNKLSFLFIGAFDNVKYFNDTEEKRYNNSRILGTDQLQYTTGVNYQRLFENGFLNVSASRVFTDFDSIQRDTLLNPIFKNYSAESENKLRAELVYQFLSTSELHFGGDFKYITTESDILFPSQYRTTFGETLPISDVNTDESFIKWDAFANWTHVYLNNTLSLNVGARVDYFDGINEKYYFSPRFGIRYNFTDITSVNFSTGIYRQFPSYIWLAAGGRNLDLTAIRVDQYVLGLDHRLDADIQVKVEGYYKKYADYPTSLIRPYIVLSNTGAGFSGTNDNFATFGLEPLVPEGEGKSYGFEFSLQKKLSDTPVYGIISATYNQSEFTPLDGIERHSSYEQEWIFNVSGGYQFSENWEASVKFRFASGQPYTPYNADGTQNISDYLSERFDPIHSLDIRVDRRWFFESMTLITYLDIQNVYNRNNVTTIRWDPLKKEVDKTSNIGILPSIGISLEF